MNSALSSYLIRSQFHMPALIALGKMIFRYIVYVWSFVSEVTRYRVKKENQYASVKRRIVKCRLSLVYVFNSLQG